MEFVTVKVGKLPGTFAEVGVAEGATVEQAIAASSVGDTAGYQVRLNGEVAPLTGTVEDGDVITLVKQIKGA